MTPKFKYNTQFQQSVNKTSPVLLAPINTSQTADHGFEEKLSFIRSFMVIKLFFLVRAAQIKAKQYF